MGALADLIRFLAFASISADPRYAAASGSCAAWLAGHLRRIGMREAGVVATAGRPIVHASWREAPGAPTLLIYGHYDVQPPDPLAEWHTPPFQPTLRGSYLFARGATDDKGQLFAHVKALERLLAGTGRLPINVVCLFEGEEETGSTHFLPFLRKHADRLRGDLAVVSDTTMPAPDRPAVIYALRGALALELEVTGQELDLHSGQFGGMVHNPLQALCEMVSGLHDRQGRIAIAGLYRTVATLAAAERSNLKASGPGDRELLRRAGTDRSWGERGFTLYERTTARPALIVTGITGGYQGTGGKGVIPRRASAKIEIRLVPEQNPREIERLFRLHIERVTPPGLTVSVKRLTSVEPVKVDVAHGHFRAVEKAYRRGFGSRPVYRRSGGSIPVVATLQELGMPVALMGFGLADANIHAPNESLYLPNFFRGVATSVQLMKELGGCGQEPGWCGAKGGSR